MHFSSAPVVFLTAPGVPRPRHALTQSCCRPATFGFAQTVGRCPEALIPTSHRTALAVTDHSFAPPCFGFSQLECSCVGEDMSCCGFILGGTCVAWSSRLHWGSITHDHQVRRENCVSLICSFELSALCSGEQPLPVLPSRDAIWVLGTDLCDDR